MGPPQILIPPLEPHGGVPEEELKSEYNGKVARNNGELNLGRTHLDPKLKNNCCLLSSIFYVEGLFRRYLPKKPPENAGVGENKPIGKQH